jgi:recombination endonuclease VII
MPQDRPLLTHCKRGHEIALVGRVNRGCKACLKILKLGYRQRYRTRYARLQRNARLKKAYGISPEQYEKMLDKQGGVCALCFRAPKKIPLPVDHDHHSGRVRGLLCFFCNRHRLARANDTDWQIYERLLAYIRSDFDGRKI